jgi:molybdopterin/thiamine biosynthesis adenylyltransferase
MAEYMGRLGLKRLIIMDGDKFAPSNMNRQLYCNIDTLGMNKAEVASERLRKITDAEIITAKAFFPSDELTSYEGEIDIIADCLDNVPSRLELERFAARLNVPIVHGALCGYSGEVTTVMPGKFTLSKLYEDKRDAIAPTSSYVPSLIASLQAAEIVNCLRGTPGLDGILLLVDTETLTFRKLQL